MAEADDVVVGLGVEGDSREVAGAVRLLVDNELRRDAEATVAEATAMDVAQTWVVGVLVECQPKVCRLPDGPDSVRLARAGSCLALSVLAKETRGAAALQEEMRIPLAFANDV